MSEVQPLTPRIVQVAFDDLTDKDEPCMTLEEGLLFSPTLVISRFEKFTETGCVSLWARSVKPFVGSDNYGVDDHYVDLLFHDTEDLLKDMMTLTVVEFLNKYLAREKNEGVQL